jgi:predicted patatin/cPLA2 family phospholipase
MRGAVTAGMCVALERAGLLPAFDRIYGCSSGALAGCYAAAGQAELWSRSFEDAACRAFIDPRRALRRRPVLDLDYLFGTVCRNRRPLSAAGLAHGPELRTVAVTADSGAQRILAGLNEPAEALAAVRASCTIPLLAGAPMPFRGELLVDGGLLEPIPFRAALHEGATHVLVLRSRHERWRAVERATLVERALGRTHPALAPLLVSCHVRYNADADALARGDHPGVVQIAPPAAARLVGRFSTDGARIAHTVALGAACMARLLAGDPAPAPRRVPFPAVPVPAAPASVAPHAAAP